MAVVKPFRAVRFNRHHVADLQTVVSQPYDKIDDALRERYLALSPHNMVRIILNPPQPGDDPASPQGPNVYTRARDTYQAWLREGILCREEQPAFYVYAQTFRVNGHVYTRHGLIAAIALTDFAEGTILPHERTHSGPQEDRLRLLATVGANTEQIFILYPDVQNTVNRIAQDALGDRPPDVDIAEPGEPDVRQQLWALTDPPALAAIESALAPLRGLIIADGHHRYSTGLTYRDQQRRAHPNAPPNAAFNFVQATLVSMDDPGLVILPTHREICQFSERSAADVLRRAAQAFTVAPVASLEACLAQVNADPAGHAFGFYGGPGTGFHVLTLKEAALAQTLIAGDHSPQWKALSVSVLHKILIEQVAGVPARGIEDKTMIRYHRDPHEPVASIDAGRGNFAFFLRATRLDQIRTVAAQGEPMPQKSTDFYPKVISGLTMLPVGPDEQL